MKRSIIVSIVLIVSVLRVTGQTEKEIKAEIKHVTVFPDRAQIDHETSVSLLSGKSVLKLSGLSPYIDVQSIQVKGYGEFTILSVNHQNNYLQNLEDSPEVKSIRSQIEALQLKIEDENASISTLKEKQAFLIANRAILVKETTFTIEQLKNVMDLYTSNMDQITMTTLKKERLIKDYNKQILALQQQLPINLAHNSFLQVKFWYLLLRKNRFQVSLPSVMLCQMQDGILHMISGLMILKILYQYFIRQMFFRIQVSIGKMSN
jgi:competence protein ComGC